MAKAERYYSLMGLGSFSNGNAEGGLTTQEEKIPWGLYQVGRCAIAGVILPTQQTPFPQALLMDVAPDGELRFGYPEY